MPPQSPLPRRVSLGLAPRLEAGLVHVDAVQEGSSAESSGLAVGDRLVRVGAIEPVDPDSLAHALRAVALLSSIAVVVERGGQRVELTLERRTAGLEPGPTELVTIEVSDDARLRLRGHLVRAVASDWLVVIVGGLADTPCEILDGSYGASFAQFVDTLARNQVSTLRFDRRGIGDSEGDATQSSLTDDLSDARAALRFAREHHQGNIALFGHSTGAVTAALAREVSWPHGHATPLAIFGAPADPWFECLREGTQRHHVRQGLPEAEAEAIANEETTRVAAWAHANGPGTFEARSASWHAELATHDPVRLLGTPNRSTLVLDGGRDLAVPRSAAVRLARVCATQPRVFPELDHTMQQNPSTRECVVALELIRWLASHA